MAFASRKEDEDHIVLRQQQNGSSTTINVNGGAAVIVANGEQHNNNNTIDNNKSSSSSSSDHGTSSSASSSSSSKQQLQQQISSSATATTTTTISSSSSMSSSSSRTTTTTKSFQQQKPTTPMWTYLSLIFFAVLTIITLPTDKLMSSSSSSSSDQQIQQSPPTLKHVFFYGLMTCLSTGLGVIPFFFIPEIASFWVGISNAIAAGMMIAASYTLFLEGCTYNDPNDTSEYSSETRTALGSAMGLIFILVTKHYLDQYEDLKLGSLDGTNAKRALLVFFVMLLHSFSEGVGVGVSFGGIHGNELGIFISASLAVHNIPEGLAIAVVLLPRNFSVLTATVYAIATSLPQPIMAIPSFLFVNSVIPFLPIGLGFAGGAMAFVAFFELLMEAIEDTNLLTTCLVATPALLGMLTIQSLLEDGSVLNII